MKFSMSFTPLSLSEVHRRRSKRLSSQFSVQTGAVSAHECTENEEEEVEA